MQNLSKKLSNAPGYIKIISMITLLGAILWFSSRGNDEELVDFVVALNNASRLTDTATTLDFGRYKLYLGTDGILTATIDEEDISLGRSTRLNDRLSRLQELYKTHRQEFSGDEGGEFAIENPNHSIATYIDEDGSIQFESGLKNGDHTLSFQMELHANRPDKKYKPQYLEVSYMDEQGNGFYGYYYFEDGQFVKEETNAEMLVDHFSILNLINETIAIFEDPNDECTLFDELSPTEALSEAIIQIQEDTTDITPSFLDRDCK